MHYAPTQFACGEKHAPGVQVGGGTLSKETLFALRGNTEPIEAQSSAVVRVARLTRRDEGVLDCIALGERAQVLICTLDDMSIQSSYIINSSNGCCVFCSSLNSVRCTREGSGKENTTLHCPIVYPHWG